MEGGESDAAIEIDGKVWTSDESNPTKNNDIEDLYNGRNDFSLHDIPNEIFPKEDSLTEKGSSDIDEVVLDPSNENLDESPAEASPIPEELDMEPEQNGFEKIKIRRKIQHNYTDSTLQEALDVVQSQNVSIMHAAKQFSIPRSTLRRYALMVWAAATRKTKGKHETALTSEEESYLVSMITKMSRAGKYVSTMDVKSTVQYLLDKSQRVVFKDRNRPNAGWVQRFRKRHKNLQINGSGYTLKRHGPLCPMDVVEWHREISDYLRQEWEVDAAEIFTVSNSQRIFNLDEMALYMNYRQDLITESITSTRGFEDVYTEVTIMAAVSAAGEITQPLIIQKGEGGGHEDDIMPLDQSSYGISFSISGKMNGDIFLRWLEAFDKELAEKGVRKPIVILLDDVFAHFHISVFSFAMDNGIILLCLPCQPLCLMHPIHGELFERVKDAYSVFCREHYATSFQPVTVDQFPETFLQAWESVRDEEFTSDKLRLAFRDYGLVPLDSNASGLSHLFTLAEKEHRESVSFKADCKTKPTKVYKAREQKAKKTLTARKRKLLPPPTNTSDLLVPTVKIRKLDPIDTTVKTCFSDDDDCEQEDDDICDDIDDAGRIPSCSTNTFHPVVKQEAKERSHGTVSSERLSGRLDGMQKCIELMESFIPNDIVSIWQQRDEEIKPCSEIPFCMWKAVTALCSETASEKTQKNPRSNKGFVYYP